MDLSEHIIQPDSRVIVRTLKGQHKIIEMKNAFNLVKYFGTIPSAGLIGQPFGASFEIMDASGDSDKLKLRLVVESNDGVDESCTVVDENTKDNRDIFDHGDSQRLTQQDVLELKSKVQEGELEPTALVEALIQNNSSFEKRTDFSKAKYIQRKTKKFVKRFKVVKPTFRELCEHYLLKNPQRTLCLRSDTLGMMLVRANLQAGSRVLVVDETGGLLTGAVLSRLGGHGVVLSFQDHAAPKMEIMEHFALSAKERAPLHYFPWRLLASSAQQEQSRLQEAEETSSKRLDTIRKQTEQRVALRQLLDDDLFDALLMATKCDPISVCKVLRPYIGLSRPLVAFGMHMQPLLACAQYLREDEAAIDVRLTESFVRPYQVLPKRTHPENNISASGGYVLSAIQVSPSMIQKASAPIKDGPRKAKEENEVTAKTDEDVEMEPN